MAALAKEGSPLGAIMDADGTGTLAGAIAEDFGFLRFLGVSSRVDDREANERWAAVIRWLVARIRDWKRSDDQHMRELAALLLASSLCGGKSGLWDILPDDIRPSAEFLDGIGSFVAKRRIVYDVRGAGAAPIWEREFIEAFERADAAGNWDDIADLWPRLEPVVRPDTLFTEMVRCLRRYGFGELVRAADALQQCPLVIALVRALSPAHRLRLALGSSSDRVRFCCAYCTVVRNPQASALSADELAALAALLIEIAASPEEWRKWIKAFNTYPVRYPFIQRSLGHALARVPVEAARTYIDSITLHATRITDADESRGLVSACLRAFSQYALPEHRHAVWSYAHQRWRDWRFGAATPGTYLFDISRSPLDFAIASYAFECLSAGDRDGAMTELRGKLSEIELAWHTTETDCTTEWNRVLSLFQPYAHAYTLTDGDSDALPGPKVYYPFDLSQSLYHRIMFRSQHP
jgi:hypothetical protein